VIVPPDHCHHCHRNPSEDYEGNARAIRELAHRVLEVPGDRVIVRYAIEPMVDITVLQYDDSTPEARRKLARFDRELTADPIKAFTIHRWTFYEPQERRELEFGSAAPPPGGK
jgi:hypothetical protein